MNTTKTLPAFQIGQNCGVAEREGNPMATIIPVKNKFQKDQAKKREAMDRFFAIGEKMRESASAFPPEEVDQAIKEAVAEAKAIELKELQQEEQEKLKQA